MNRLQRLLNVKEEMVLLSKEGWNLIHGVVVCIHYDTMEMSAWESNDLVSGKTAQFEYGKGKLKLTDNGKYKFEDVLLWKEQIIQWLAKED